MATGSPSSAFTLDLRRRRRTRKGEGRGRRNRERRESDVSVIYLNAIRFWRKKINDLGEPVYRIKRTSRIRLDDKFYRYAKVDISHFCRYFRSGRDARHFLLRKTIKRTTNGRRGRFEFRLRVVFKRKVILFSRNGWTELTNIKNIDSTFRVLFENTRSSSALSVCTFTMYDKTAANPNTGRHVIRRLRYWRFDNDGRARDDKIPIVTCAPCSYASGGVPGFHDTEQFF